MKVTDIILDYISELTIFEMARSRQDAKRIVTDLSPQIVLHLIKLFVFNSPQNKQHWINEVNTWFGKIDDIYLKPSNKKPDWQTVYNWIVFDSSPHYDSNYIDSKVKKMINAEYSTNQLYDYDAESVLNQILKIVERCSKDMANDQFTTIGDYL